MLTPVCMAAGHLSQFHLDTIDYAEFEKLHTTASLIHLLDGVNLSVILVPKYVIRLPGGMVLFQ